MSDLPPLPDKDWLLAQVGPSRAAWDRSQRPARIEPAGPGDESVWDYPRPPELRPAPDRARVVHGGCEVAASDRALRMVETAGAPVYLFPPDDVRMDLLQANDHVTACEWKGAAVHFDLVMPDLRVRDAAFAYPDPLDDLGQGYGRIAGWIASYPSRVDACFVGDEQVRPQPGGYYAGWVTDAIKGPIKGDPGTEGW
ncbi:DUF427 domain-containing protein [Pyruvatibacter mobilis]|uniref:DUF427 domain-containing protein n=1 Tax=Pyruvatibacter mobilis TaxID=1712261 RepID=UPI003D0ADA2F